MTTTDDVVESTAGPDTSGRDARRRAVVDQLRRCEVRFRQGHEQRLAAVDAARAKAVEARREAEAMVRAADEAVVAAEDAVTEAVELLAGSRDALLVTVDGRAAGIVTRADLLEALAR